MSGKWLGLTVSGDIVTMVGLDCSDQDYIPEVLVDQTMKLQSGDRLEAYNFMYKRVFDYVNENDFSDVVIKSSALSRNTKLAHLKSAELRGVVLAACAASNAKAVQLAKAVVSKTFGERKADEYISDESFWEDEIDGSIRKSSREAALLVLSKTGK